MDAQLARARAYEHRHEQALGDRLGEQTLDLFLRKCLAFEILHHEFVVRLGNSFAQLLTRFLGRIEVLFGNVELGLRGTIAMARLHAYDIDDALEGIARAPRQSNGTQAHAKALAERLHAGIVIGVLLIDAIDEHRARKAQVFRGVPQLHRGGLRAFGGVDHEERGLAHAHGGVGIADEVRIARASSTLMRTPFQSMGAIEVEIENSRLTSSAS